MMRTFLLTLVVVVVVACSKDYNSDLHGRWQLQTTVQNGVVQRIDSIYYSFDNHVVSIQNKRNAIDVDLYFGHFKQEGDSLILDFVDQNPIRTERYFIEKLDSKALVLRTHISTLNFRKF